MTTWNDDVDSLLASTQGVFASHTITLIKVTNGTFNPLSRKGETTVGRHQVSAERMRSTAAVNSKTGKKEERKYHVLVTALATAGMRDPAMADRVETTETDPATGSPVACNWAIEETELVNEGKVWEITISRQTNG